MLVGIAVATFVFGADLGAAVAFGVAFLVVCVFVVVFLVLVSVFLVVFVDLDELELFDDEREPPNDDRPPEKPPARAPLAIYSLCMAMPYLHFSLAECIWRHTWHTLAPIRNCRPPLAVSSGPMSATSRQLDCGRLVRIQRYSWVRRTF